VGAPYAANDNVYVSYRVIPHAGPLPGDAATKLADAADQADGNKYFLKLIDYTDSANPVASSNAINIPGELRGLSRDGGLLYTAGAALDPTTGACLDNGYSLQVSGFDGAEAHLLDQLSLTSPTQPLTVSGETVFLLDPQPEQIWTPPVVDPAPTGTSGGTLNVAGNNSLNFSGGVIFTAISFWPPYNYNGWSANPKNSSLSTYEVGDDGKFAQLGSITLNHELAFTQFDGLTVLRNTGRTIRMLDSRDPQKLLDLGTFTLEAYGGSSLENAAADVSRGLWLPLWAYGVEIVPLNSAGSQ
jgi:hypothetical protein